MAVLTSAIDAAVANESPRRTVTGDAWRSAIAPKMRGDTNAARADVANANGLIAFNPFAPSTVLNGTKHMPRAAPWMNNRPINSAYSALRSVLSTRTERMDGEKFQARSFTGFHRHRFVVRSARAEKLD